MNLKGIGYCACASKTHIFSTMINLPFMTSLKGSIRPREMFDNVMSFDLQHIVIIANRLMNTLYEIHLHQRRLIKAKRLSKKLWIFPQSSSRKLIIVIS